MGSVSGLKSEKGNFSVEIYCLSLIKRHVGAIKKRTDYRTVNKNFNKKSALCRVVVYIDFLLLSTLSTIDYREGEMKLKSVFKAWKFVRKLVGFGFQEVFCIIHLCSCPKSPRRE